ncbi:hypothetical protein ABL78_4875 [Leptomonas seymouri]|uniref:Uncharacterized protein n=1 Tax=Leptomonas seymouri TaxID=5684 RepID=A0A0N1I4A2_LEPSE|nr:hypothetical protein ABL78_4875 [Leptomonas seymouri]|eukprot:KPI86073.1 hypothetical protein ABL78_4875 [Leptomonas seymouri]
MSRTTNERAFSEALGNEYQWHNLYLKEFGCCTYAPPIPKDPTTTAEGIYPLRRQVPQLIQPFSESDSDDFSETGDDQRESLSPIIHSTTGREISFQSASHTESSDVQAHGNTSDQFFSLNLLSRQSNMSSQLQRSTSRRLNGSRRSNRGATLRKDDFFDVNDAFSMKFFGFLWRQNDEDDDLDETIMEDEEDVEEDRGLNADSLGESSSFSRSANNTICSYTSVFDARRRRPKQPYMGSAESTIRDPHKLSGRLTFSTNKLFLAGSCNDFHDNPHGVHDAMLRLHHETWVMLMDNRLTAWLHRQAANHYQTATQLRQRLLDVVARGPSAVVSLASSPLASTRRAGDASGPNRSTALPHVRNQEEALQSTLESFSPFFVVIAPAAAVHRAKKQFQAARRAQLRSASRAASTTPADLVGLPLYSQYGSWREAYEHRQRWSKAPFSFFLLHDCSYNYTQVSAIFVQLHLLYVHAHTHTRRCAEVKPESMSLQDASQQLTSNRVVRRAVEFQRSMCPLTAMQELTENIILAYEQSSSRTTLTMLRRVLDFLTDIALDVVTAHRFISREALLRQSGFGLPGMEVQQTRTPPTTPAMEPAAAVAAAASKNVEKSIASMDTEDMENTNMDADDITVDESQTALPSDTTESRAAQENSRQSLSKHDEPAVPTLSPATMPTAFLEPQRVTENDVNDLFEVAYWFVDTATANANVPMDPDLLHQAFKRELGDGSAHQAAATDSMDAPPPQLRASILQPRTETQSLTNERYLPGKEQVYNAVESFVEAVELLEAHRRPLWMQHATPKRGQSPGKNKVKKAMALSRGEHLSSSSGTAGASTAAFSPPLLSADSFTGLITPMVLLTTYIRLHGGQWLKQLCNRIFDTLRRQSVLLYVNTADLDFMWARLQDPSPGSSTERHAFAAAAASNPLAASSPFSRGRARRTSVMSPRVSFSAAAPTSLLLPIDAASDIEGVRQSFVEGLEHYEAVISQNILYAITDFFDVLHGKRSTGRLPHGISVLLTQFVTTVHLFLLEDCCGGGMGGGLFSTSKAADVGGLGDKAHQHSSGHPSMGGHIKGKMMPGQHGSRHATFSNSPSRQVEERLQVCKQRYYANLRRCQLGSAGAHSTAATSASKGRGSRQAQHKMARVSPTAAAASMKRLIQTIEHHRLAKFILFDCWILPALSNAVSLGYLAPDSPLHLRWNVDALVRYLKVLVHAPFANQDKATFASLTPQCSPNTSSGNKASDIAGGVGGMGKNKSNVPPRISRQKLNKSADSRGQQTSTLSLPPCLTGIYDVATGSLVRLQAAAPATTTLPAVETSMASLSRYSVAAKPASAPARLTPNMTDPIAVKSSRRSFVFSGNDMDELSVVDSQGVGWTQSKQTIFQSFPTAKNPDGGAGGLLDSPISSASDKNEDKRQAGGPLSFSGSTAAPVLTKGSRNSPTEKQSLPPIKSKAGAAGSTASNGAATRDGGGMNRLSSAQATLSGAEAVETAAPNPRSRRLQRGPSITFTGNAQLGSMPSAMSIIGAAEESVTCLPHPYVVVSGAGWLGISSAMQLLNEQLGLTCCDPETQEEVEDNGLAFSHLPTAEDRHVGRELGARGAGSTAAGAGVAAMTTGLRAGMDKDISFSSNAIQQAIMDGLSAVQALNTFCKAAAADESENVVVSEFDVLPTMAAGCIEKIYDVVTGAHPIVARALQTGAFNFTQQRENNSSPVVMGFTSLYSACLNGVLLHPRTASHVMRNVFENSPAFGQVLMRPVVEGTALTLLNSLVARQGETPMVDANSIVPLLQMSSINAASPQGACGVGNHDGAGGGPFLYNCENSATTFASMAVGTAALARHWETESRRLLRQFAFLTTGFADTQRPLPLVPGIRRPVGPAHPIHMIRAGADRIASDMGAGSVPIVFDPWWRAMVVALSVKASNMFDECREEHSAAFLQMVRTSEVASKHLSRQSMTQFITTKGKETVETASEGGTTKRAPTTTARRTRNAATTSSQRDRDGRRSKWSNTSTTQSRRSQAVKRSQKLSAMPSASGAAGSAT